MKKEFLEQLLSTPSPSGNEVTIQKLWRDEVSQFADQVTTDGAGNVIASINPEADFKVLLAGHCDEIGFMVKRIDEQGFIYVEKLGGISPKPAIGMKVQILGASETVVGVIGANAEHHGGVKDDLEIEDIYIDCGARTKEELQDRVHIGDPIVYTRTYEYLENNRLSARGLDNRTGAFIVAEVLRRLAEDRPTIGVYAASTVNEETNMGGAYFAAAGLEPTFAIACDVTFATDYPSVDTNKHGEINLDGGPVLAKGAPINHKINALLERAANREAIPVQYELTPRMTGTDADRMRLTGKGVPIALVSLPLRYMHSPVETVSLHDIEQEIQLIVSMLKELTGKESVNPLD
ncbi:M20/M25/M40 family metallo-hydrolase [Pullulanibacillus sp. KACC 23026]|uniref:M20/M25/M40 family metallo-hydrolase n=1 Tax=Pullulanibacillus sp. KACC 23026 TaxID=3028315 RepID=UPI0023B16FDD|nr:M20/M25/M40 family metallo-hydrolase [Pullulanibacillus sp. KACC 23026]WEG10853.1 M20/M25/M40 family metallo-hydrolase [Pullulanibacillus sp. KACC 23026]